MSRPSTSTSCLEPGLRSSEVTPLSLYSCAIAFGAEVPKWVLVGGLLTMMLAVCLLNKGLTTLWREIDLGLKMMGFMKLDSLGERGSRKRRDEQTDGEGAGSTMYQHL